MPNVMIRALVTLVFGLLTGFAYAAAPEPLEVAVPDKVAKERLGEVLKRVKAMAQKGERPVFVFDIDDTIFEAKKGFEPDLEGKATPGSIEFARALDRAGATIIYLSGRIKKEIQTATEEQFRRAGLPYTGRHQILLNPIEKWSEEATQQWKREAQKIIRSAGKPVAFVDNEKANVRLFRDEYRKEDVAVFRLKTRSYRPDPTPALGADGIVVIGRFYAIEK